MPDHAQHNLRYFAGFLVLIGAALRVAAPWLPLDQMALLIASGALWSGGFLVFVLVYGPMLLRRRGT